MVWSRLPGDPRVWSTVEVVKSDGTKVKFIIQEIPPNRYEEALDHLCTVFIPSEAMCRSLNLIDDKKSVNELRAFWATALNQGISVGAYKVDKNDLISTLAGLNVLMIKDNNTIKTILPITNTMSKTEKLLTTLQNLSIEANSYRKQAVDYCLGAAGLDVDPNYRRLGLGTHLLLARDKIAKKYNISMTSTLFSSPASQKTAKKAGFQVFWEKSWNDVVDDEGNIIFPGLGDIYCKLMEKKFE